MKKRFSIALIICFVLSTAFVAYAFIPGTYEGEGKGYHGEGSVKVKITVDGEEITDAEIIAPEEFPFGSANAETYEAALIGRTDGNIDAVTNATMTRDGIKEAVEKALEKAKQLQ